MGISELNLRAQRIGTTTTEPLPFAMFGGNYIQSNYQKVLEDFLPSGVTVAVTTNSSGNVIFTYSSGDVITVSSVNTYTPYRTLLEQFKKCRYKMKDIMYYLSATSSAQYNINIPFIKISSLGDKQVNLLVPRGCISPQDVLTDRIHLKFEEQELRPDFCIVPSIVNTAEFILNFNIPIREIKEKE